VDFSSAMLVFGEVDCVKNNVPALPKNPLPTKDKRKLMGDSLFMCFDDVL